MRHYEYRHRVTFEDTNVIGNVYYANHVRWQGRCRELFLHEHAPQVIEELRHDITLATTRVSCAYYHELVAFDEVVIRMKARPVTPNRLTMLFDYLRVLPDGTEELVARGEQEIACLRRVDRRLVASPLPASLREALVPFTENAIPTARSPAASEGSRRV
jgi:enediyne biosynthesis thioesterase